MLSASMTREVAGSCAACSRKWTRAISCAVPRSASARRDQSPGDRRRRQSRRQRAAAVLEQNVKQTAGKVATDVAARASAA